MHLNIKAMVIMASVMLWFGTLVYAIYLGSMEKWATKEQKQLAWVLFVLSLISTIFVAGITIR